MKTLLKQLLLLGAIVFGIYAYTTFPRLAEVTTGHTPEYPDLVAHDYGAGIDSVAKAVKKVMADQSGWDLKGEAKGPLGVDLQAVHTRFGFLKDDVVVTLRREKSRTVVNVKSRSQWDAPDLGRKAQTVRELLTQLDQEVF